MNKTVELPSGTIFNIDRFIALLPVTTTVASGYQLILEGYSAPINLESGDVDALKIILLLDTNITVTYNKLKCHESDQLQKNQLALSRLAKRIQRHRNMSTAESVERGELFSDIRNQ